MKVLKLIVIFTLALITLAILIFGIYLAVNKQKPAEQFEAILGEGTNRLLIATQGSSFKDLLTAEILRKLEGEDIQIRGIDISALAEVELDRWDAFLIVHTTEKWVLPPSVEDFLKRVPSNKVVEVITSGDGDWRPEKTEVEIITSASKDERVSPVADEAVAKIKVIFSLRVLEQPKDSLAPPVE